MGRFLGKSWLGRAVGPEWSINKGLTASFALALSLLAVIGWFSNRNAMRMAYASQAVSQTYRTLVNIEGLLSQVRALESSERGYTITGDERFLEGEGEALWQANKLAQDLRTATANNRSQQERMDVLAPLLAEKTAFEEKVIAARRTGGQAGAAELIQTGRGRELMEGIRRALAEIRREEADLLERRQIDSLGDAQRILLADMAGSLASFMLLGFIFLRLNREIVERRDAEVELREKTAVMEHAIEGISRVDALGRYRTVNRAYAALAGKRPEELLGQHWLEIIHPEDRSRLSEAMERLAGGEKAEAETRVVRKDGAHVFAQAVLIEDPGRDGRFEGHFCFLKDITERRLAEEGLRRAHDELTGQVNELERRNREMRLLGELADVLQSCLNEQEAYEALSHAMQRLFPGDAGGLALIKESRNVSETVAAWGEPLGEPAFAPKGCWAVRRGKAYLSENPGDQPPCQHLAGAPPLSYVCIPMTVQGETIGSLHLQSKPEAAAQGARITEAKTQLAAAVAEQFALSLANMRLRESLRLLSIRDPLTGIYNRRFLEESFERELHRARRSGKPLGVIMLDIDRFKEFNDAFGHDAGDALLRELGGFLKGSVRGADIPCRYGGEEFTLILPEASLEVSAMRAEEMRVGAQQLSVVHAGRPLGRITLSLGVAVFPTHGSTAEELLRAADAALYLAKSGGRDRLVIAEAPALMGTPIA